jgi:hypothetical protein
VPEFAAYPPESEGLIAYGAAMSRIETLWPSAKVLAVIDESILRRTDTGDDVFDLQAYRELMLLYAVAKDLNDETNALGADLDRAASGASGYPNTAMQPLSSASARENPAFLEPAAASITVATDVTQAEIERLMQPAHSRRLGVDIDLGDAFSDDDGPTISEPRPFSAPADMLAESAESAEAAQAAEPSAEFMPSAMAPQGALEMPAANAPPAPTDAAPLPPPRPSFLKPVTSRAPRRADDNSVEFDWPESKTKHQTAGERFKDSKL